MGWDFNFIGLGTRSQTWNQLHSNLPRIPQDRDKNVKDHTVSRRETLLKRVMFEIKQNEPNRIANELRRPLSDIAHESRGIVKGKAAKTNRSELSNKTEQQPIEGNNPSMVLVFSFKY